MRDIPYDKIALIELKPCPFCGHTQRGVEPDTQVRLVFSVMAAYVQCGCCRATGFHVGVPGHIDELNEFMDMVSEVDVFGLPPNPRNFKDGDLDLWMAQLAAKFWNNRKPPRA